MLKCIKNDQGFTIIEMLIYSVISTILIIAFYFGIQQSVRTQQTASDNLFKVRDSRKAFEVIIEELKYANPASININGNTVTYLNNSVNCSITYTDSTIYLIRGTTPVSSQALTSEPVSGFAITEMGSGVYTIMLSYTNNRFFKTAVKPLN